MRLVYATLALTVTMGIICAAGTQTESNGGTRTHLATGVVKAVSASALTLEAGDDRIIFAINPSTRFIGKGLYTDLVLRSPRRATDFVKVGDRVAVTFRPFGRAMNAVQVRVVQRYLN